MELTAVGRKLGGLSWVVAANRMATAHVFKPTFQLPVAIFTQLRVLALTDLKVQLQVQGVGLEGSHLTAMGSGSNISSTASAVALLPQLQELNLWGCSLTVQLASQLLSTTALTKVQWQVEEVLDETWKTQLSGGAMHAVMWQQLQLLPKLSKLVLVSFGEGLTAAEAALISNLQSLQDISVVVQDHSAAANVAALVPLGLTALQLFVGGGNQWAASPAEVCLTRLIKLHSFNGTFVHMQPTILGGTSWLRKLRLFGPRYPDGSQWSPRALLAALQHLTQLQRLHLESCKLHTVEPQPQQQEASRYQCFSALTASTQLTALELEDWNVWPVPQAAFEHMFAPGHVMPHLKTLTVSGSNYLQPPILGAGQFAMIAASCPALQELKLYGVTPRDFDISCLAQLLPGVTTDVR